jgi:hypothetical protein
LSCAHLLHCKRSSAWKIFDSTNVKYASQLSCDASTDKYLSHRIVVKRIWHFMSPIESRTVLQCVCQWVCIQYFSFSLYVRCLHTVKGYSDDPSPNYASPWQSIPSIISTYFVSKRSPNWERAIRLHFKNFFLQKVPNAKYV